METTVTIGSVINRQVIGNGPEIDVNNYYTKEETNKLIPDVSKFITSTDADNIVSSKGYQTQADVDARIENWVGAAPEAFDTLKEIADKLNDNDDVVESLTQTISTKANSDAVFTKAETRNEITASLGEYYKKSTIDLRFQESDLYVNNKFQNYYTKEQVEDLIPDISGGGVTPEYLENYVNSRNFQTAENVDVKISNILGNPSSDLNTIKKVGDLATLNKTDIGTLKTDVLRKAEASAVYTKNQIDSKGYITSAYLNGYATESFVNLEISKNKPDLSVYDKSDVVDLKIKTAVSNLVDAAPDELNTLKELASAVSENGNLLEGLNTTVGNKANKNEVYTKSEIDNKGYLTQHQSLTEYAKTSEVNSKLNNYYTKTEVDNLLPDMDAVEYEISLKQDKLVSGTTIKTIFGESLLGAGNLTIEDFTVNLGLDNFYTKQQVNALIPSTTGFIKMTDVEAKGYQTASQVNTAITNKGYQTASQVENAIVTRGYQTASDVDVIVENKGYQTANQVERAIDIRGYMTSTQVNNAITAKGYQTAAQVNSLIDTYIKNLGYAEDEEY